MQSFELLEMHYLQPSEHAKNNIWRFNKNYLCSFDLLKNMINYNLIHKFLIRDKLENFMEIQFK
jgi:hypothetical protein